MGKDIKKYRLTGKYIDLELYFETREEAEEQMKEWIESDKKEFPGEDTSNDYFIYC